jgi:hypothetical protein
MSFLRFFKFGPSCGWTLALVLFFLPWIDVSCSGKNRTDGPQMGSLSGAQMAWGGATLYDFKGEMTSFALMDFAEATKTPDRIAAGCLLTAYVLGLTAGIAFGLMSTPGRLRSVVGAILGMVLTGLVIAAIGILISNPFWPTRRIEFSEDSPLPNSVIDVKFTSWYFASYAANSLSIGSFIVEFFAVRARTGFESR